MWDSNANLLSVGNVITTLNKFTQHKNAYNSVDETQKKIFPDLESLFF